MHFKRHVGYEELQLFVVTNGKCLSGNGLQKHGTFQRAKKKCSIKVYTPNMGTQEMKKDIKDIVKIQTDQIPGNIYYVRIFYKLHFW